LHLSTRSRKGSSDCLIVAAAPGDLTLARDANSLWQDTDPVRLCLHPRWRSRAPDPRPV